MNTIRLLRALAFAVRTNPNRESTLWLQSLYDHLKADEITILIEEVRG